MKNFFKAIMDRYAAGQVAARATKLYNTEAEPDAVFPYIVFSTDNTKDWTFTEEFEDFLIQFDIYSDQPSVEEVSDIFDLLTDRTKGGFDFVDLTITGFVPVRCQRENSRLMKWDINGKLVWNWFVVYRIRIQKN
jgi:hypothetical protein